MIDRRINDLEMSGEHIVEQSKTLKYLNNLVKLTLDGNGITTLDILSTLENLEELDLSRNRDLTQVQFNIQTSQLNSLWRAVHQEIYKAQAILQI
ncbi:Leucine-rich_repeat domain superfamily [Hexamita inflata]|uniref:Leucine-rich repeat domain superfamily n=1 Tax=Hexamita inflata TaxID=28002 RepID=A0AA86NE62_9EUKA|nr:Leucine-rich repeat domain superfamily [Hexamita inflata]